MQGEEGREKEDTKKEVGITTAITLKRQLGMRSGTPSGKVGLLGGVDGLLVITVEKSSL